MNTIKSLHPNLKLTGLYIAVALFVYSGLFVADAAVSKFQPKLYPHQQEIAYNLLPTPTPTATPTPSPTMTPTPSPTLVPTIAVEDQTVECVGPDGKHFFATQKDCKAFNKAWEEDKKRREATPAPVVPHMITISCATRRGDVNVTAYSKDEAKKRCDFLQLVLKRH